MGELPFPTLGGRIDNMRKMDPLILDQVSKIPPIIHNLQQNGIAHADLHDGNIAFDPQGRRLPYVLDFGRTILLKPFLATERERAAFRTLEYSYLH